MNSSQELNMEKGYALYIELVFSDLALILDSAECKHYVINAEKKNIHSFILSNASPWSGLWWIPGMLGMTHAWMQHQSIGAHHLHTF